MALRVRSQGKAINCGWTGLRGIEMIKHAHRQHAQQRQPQLAAHRRRFLGRRRTRATPPSPGRARWRCRGGCFASRRGELRIVRLSCAGPRPWHWRHGSLSAARAAQGPQAASTAASAVLEPRGRTLEHGAGGRAHSRAALRRAGGAGTDSSWELRAGDALAPPTPNLAVQVEEEEGLQWRTRTDKGNPQDSAVTQVDAGGAAVLVVCADGGRALGDPAGRRGAGAAAAAADTSGDGRGAAGRARPVDSSSRPVQRALLTPRVNAGSRLSPRQERVRAGRGPRQEERGLKLAQKTRFFCSQAVRRLQPAAAGPSKTRPALCEPPLLAPQGGSG